MDTQFTLSGPAFHGKAGPILEHFMHEVTGLVAKDAQSEVLFIQQQDFKNPTGHYWSLMNVQTVEGMTGHSRLVNDRDAIYGSWLEGTSSRNQTTRFKGYATWRRGYQKVLLSVPRWADDAARRILGGSGLTVK